jgi:hypothetical protein
MNDYRRHKGSVWEEKATNHQLTNSINHSENELWLHLMYIVQYQASILTRSYKEQNTGVQDPNQEVIDKVNPCVINEMNAMLMATYLREALKKRALFNIGDLKAPGHDGLHIVFYKHFWHIIGEDLMDEVLLAVN